jgi:hypothetical protein
MDLHGELINAELMRRMLGDYNVYLDSPEPMTQEEKELVEESAGPVEARVFLQIENNFE